MRQRYNTIWIKGKKQLDNKSDEEDLPGRSSVDKSEMDPFIYTILPKFQIFQDFFLGIMIQCMMNIFLTAIETVLKQSFITIKVGAG